MAAAADFANPKCTGDFPVEDLPDLERFGAISAQLETNPSLAPLVLGIAGLRLPLSAVRDVALANIS